MFRLTIEGRREIPEVGCSAVTSLHEHPKQPGPARLDVEVAEVTVQSWCLEVPIHREHLELPPGEQHRDVGERHAAADAAFIRVERDDAVHGPVNLGTVLCTASAC